MYSMKNEVKVGDIWEGRAPNEDWVLAIRFQVDKISGKTATMHSTTSGDVTKVGVDFAEKNEIWRLVKRRGRKTFCEECNPN